MIFFNLSLPTFWKKGFQIHFNSICKRNILQPAFFLNFGSKRIYYSLPATALPMTWESPMIYTTFPSAKKTFFLRLVIVDESCILYDNLGCKPSWSSREKDPIPFVNAGLRPKSVLLYWPFRIGVSPTNIFPQNQTINFEEFGSQLDELKAAIAVKCPKIAKREGFVFHHAKTNISGCHKLIPCIRLWRSAPPSLLFWHWADLLLFVSLSQKFQSPIYGLC